MKLPKDYESTVMRMAGNIAGAILDVWSVADDARVVARSVALARAIVTEVQRTAGERADPERP